MKPIRLTTDHSASSYGLPVFVRGREALDYAEGVRALRRERGWNCAALGRLAGVSPLTVENWEQGRRPPSAEALLRLAAALASGEEA